MGGKRLTSDRNTALSLQALRGPSPEVQWAGKGSAAVGVGTRKHVCKRKECPLFLSIANIANGRYVLDELFRQGRHPSFAEAPGLITYCFPQPTRDLGRNLQAQPGTRSYGRSYR